MSHDINVPEFRFEKYKADWVKSDLGELIGVGSAARVHKEQWTEQGVPFYRTSDVVSIYKNQANTQAFISHELYELLSCKTGKIQRGDLLITGGGSIGIPFLVKNDDPLYFKDADLLWLKNNNKMDAYFLFMFFASRPFRNYLKSISHVGTIGHYTISQAKATPISYCDREEQDDLGKYFQKLDTLINQHQEKYEKLCNLKKAMLEKMFPKAGETVPEIRFDGFSSEWFEVQLGETARIKGRLGWKSLKQNEYISSGPAMIAGKHIKNGRIDWSKVDHIPEWRYLESPEIMLKNDDVIFSKDGSLGNPVVVENLQGKATINSTMMLVRPSDNLDSNYFYQVLNTKIFKDLIKEKVSGSSIPHLFQADMKQFKFYCTSLEEQYQIGVYFKRFDTLIEQHQQQITKLKNIKQACLDKMFV